MIAKKHKANPVLPSAKLDSVNNIIGTKLTIQPAVIKNKDISFIISCPLSSFFVESHDQSYSLEF